MTRRYAPRFIYTIKQLKSVAKDIKRNSEKSHMQALNAAAKLYGHSNYDQAKAAIENKQMLERAETASEPTRSVSRASSTPRTMAGPSTLPPSSDETP